jgi:nodulation protein E
MRHALEDARLAPQAIDYVAAHGTSTPKNDATETRALHRVFGAHAVRLAVSSPKGQLGHTLAAAGVLNVIAAARAIAGGEIPPTGGFRTPDPACDLDYVPRAGRRGRVRAALANAFAFGGHNVVIALGDPHMAR